MPLLPSTSAPPKIAIRQVISPLYLSRHPCSGSISCIWSSSLNVPPPPRWNNVGENIWKNLGDQEEVVSIEKFGGDKTSLKERIEERERLVGLINKAKKDKHLRDIRGFEGRYWKKNVFARPNGLREKAETAISRRRPGPTGQKKEIYQ